LKAHKLEPGLYIVATPIGNLRDMTFRAVDTLAGADVIACEDTRVTAKLLSAYEIGTATVAYHEHNAAKMRPKLLDRLRQGEIVALVSDAGTPLISDPGYKLVRAAIDVCVTVTALPGANAPVTALAAAGLPTDRFLFAGFLPVRAAARLRALWSVHTVSATLVFFESARRLAASLQDMFVVLGDREVVVARELTKRFEEFRRGSLETLAKHYAESDPPKGEIVVLVGPADETASKPQDLDALLRDALERMSVRDAAATVSIATGRSRREVYARALLLGSEGC